MIFECIFQVVTGLFKLGGMALVFATFWGTILFIISIVHEIFHAGIFPKIL